MSEEKYSAFDKKAFRVEIWGMALLRVLCGITSLVIFWNILWAVPIVVRIISLVAIGFAYDWIFSAIVKIYITKVLARISPEWAEMVEIIYKPMWKWMKLSK